MRLATTREVMRKKNIRIKDLAKRLKVSERTVYRYLADEPSEMIKIALETVVDEWGEK